MRVEADAWTSHGDREQQLSARLKYALKLGGRLASTQRVELVSIPAEADVLRYVQTAHRLQRPIGERQGQHRACNRLQPLDLGLQRAYIDVGDVGKRCEKTDQIYTGPNVNMALGR